MSRPRAIFPICVSAEHAAKAMRVPVRLIREAISMGELAAYKEPGGTRIRIPVRSLENWVATSWTPATVRKTLRRVT
jgi:excisionase family DNA binding protein